MNKYFKNISQYSVKFFFYNEEEDKLDGFFEEIKTDNRLTLRKYDRINSAYNNASTNPVAIELKDESVEITYQEYNMAYLILMSMIEDEEYLIDSTVKYVSQKKETEVVLDTVYTD